MTCVIFTGVCPDTGCEVTGLPGDHALIPVMAGCGSWLRICCTAAFACIRLYARFLTADFRYPAFVPVMARCRSQLRICYPAAFACICLDARFLTADFRDPAFVPVMAKGSAEATAASQRRESWVESFFCVSWLASLNM